MGVLDRKLHRIKGGMMPFFIDWYKVSKGIEAEDRELARFKISKIIRHSCKPKNRSDKK